MHSELGTQIEAPAMPGAHRRPSLLAWLLNTIRLWSPRPRRRVEMSGLDDRTLKDIGLTRAGWGDGAARHV